MSLRTLYVLCLSLIMVGVVACAPSCRRPSSGGVVVTDSAAEGGAGPGMTTVEIQNTTDKDATVYLAFGADSAVLPAALPFCMSSGLTCAFSLPKKSTQQVPLSGLYLNVTLSFHQPVTCGTTKAELNVNNPKWYNTLDVSLVDGFNAEVLIEVLEGGEGGSGSVLGPTWTKEGNEKNFGVFPLGCDICTARQNPPCGMSPGKDGCKSGTQYKPDVPCQYQGASMGGTVASSVRVTLLDGQPALPKK